MTGNYKQQIIDYLNDTLGFTASLDKLPDMQLKELPLYLKQSNSYYILTIERHKFILVFSKDKIPKTALQLKRQSQIIFKHLGMKVIVGMDSQSSVFRKRLIQEKVNFIIPANRLYLPELLVDLKEYFPEPEIYTESLSPSSQLLLLYHLQIEYLDTLSFKEIAEKLGYAPKTITKAAAELKAKDICKVIGTKEKKLLLENNRKQLWKLVESQLQSPVYKVVYVNSIKNESLLSSGNWALYHYTHYTASPFVEEKRTYAIYRSEFEKLKEQNHWEVDEIEGNIRIEIWKYNPQVLSNGKYVDFLSFCLCHKDNPDELKKVEIRELLLRKVWE